jgi:hypothetical protein
VVYNSLPPYPRLVVGSGGLREGGKIVGVWFGLPERVAQIRIRDRNRGRARAPGSVTGDRLTVAVAGSSVTETVARSSVTETVAEGRGPRADARQQSWH